MGGQVQDTKAKGAIVAGVRPGVDASRCLDCGAVRRDLQLGLEATPEEYVARIVEVFREARRVLREDGTLWLNLGDSYASNGGHSDTNHADRRAAMRIGNRPGNEYRSFRQGGGDLKPKDLAGIPWMVALALRADGWYLRSDIVWAKPNPMPESVRDRPTKAHEYLFLLTKSPRYFYDAEAIREGDAGADHPRNETPALDRGQPGAPPHRGLRKAEGRNGAGRNARSVWTIATHPYPEAHFATFPPALPRRCILAGTSEHGCCPECGAPRERVIDVEYDNPGNRSTNGPRSTERRHLEHGSAGYAVRLERRSTTTGWRPTCDHEDEPVPATVLDPFAGSGTTGMVARQLGRHFVGIELSPEYAAMAERRIGEACAETVLEKGGKMAAISGPLFDAA